MANITNERLAELVELYKKLKERILYIDKKYALDYAEPELDMPNSLNLTKLAYTPKTTEELMAIAEQEVAASIISKQSSLDQNYNTKIKNLTNKLAQLQLTMDQKLQDILDGYYAECESLRRRLANNGLIFSTIATKYNEQLKQDLQTKTAKKTEESHAQMNLVVQQQQDAEEIYKERCDSLEQEKQARIDQKYQQLVESEQTLERNIKKYNVGLDEKEAKYQASRAKAYEAARRAAYNRAYNNSKLYLQYGEIGYRRMIEREKYTVSQDAFYTLRRDEANAILNMDSFLVVHRGAYYSAFEDWVNMTLLP